MHDWMHVPTNIITCGGELKLVFVTKCERPAEITLYNNSLMNMYHVMNMYMNMYNVTVYASYYTWKYMCIAH